MSGCLAYRRPRFKTEAFYCSACIFEREARFAWLWWLGRFGGLPRRLAI